MSAGMPWRTYQSRRSSHQYSYHWALSAGGTKNSISICSNSRVRKIQFCGVISLRNALPTWAMPNGGFLRVVVQHVGEVGEHALRRLRAEVGDGGGVLDRAGVGLEHQVELAGLGERAVLAAARAGVRIVELVEAEAVLAVGAVDERVGEVRQVAAGLPHLRRPEDGGVDQHDVVALLDHRPDPRVLDVAQHQRAERPVVVGAAEPAVDLRRRVHEPAPLAQVDDLIELGRRHRIRLRPSGLSGVPRSQLGLSRLAQQDRRRIDVPFRTGRNTHATVINRPEVLTLFTRQHGVAAVRQLERLGVSRKAVARHGAAGIARAGPPSASTSSPASRSTSSAPPWRCSSSPATPPSSAARPPAPSMACATCRATRSRSRSASPIGRTFRHPTTLVRTTWDEEGA